jgi:hypothetical protein
MSVARVDLFGRQPLVGIPVWVLLLSVVLAAMGIWFSLRGRIPAWLLVILTVVLAPVGGLLLLVVFGVIYASVVAL